MYNKNVPKANISINEIGVSPTDPTVDLELNIMWE